ncbi:MAG: RluA family pseudouridine synthase [Deltaproteobacteria bacterium]|nr:RluA family pseudouridine synthase [Deltaproteobacteria bacterium]
MLACRSEKVVQRWYVPHHLGGIRADRYLVHHIGRISRNKAQKIIEAGDFKLSSALLKPSRKLRSGDTVELWRIPPDSPEDLLSNIKVIFEDEKLLILSKPGDLAIHPTARYLYRTLTYWLKVNYPGQSIHPCHRLDRETSGLLICAKTKEAESQIKKAFMNGEIHKTYLALVDGRLVRPIICERPLALQGSRGLVAIKMIEDQLDGLPCHTEFKPLHHDPVSNWTLVECTPKTGRQHQIRAHLALEGYPIVGDKLYGMGEAFFDAYTKHEANLTLLPLPHQALHAWKIRFCLDGVEYGFEAECALLGFVGN